jgi:Xaa-Pro dipeptidase
MIPVPLSPYFSGVEMTDSNFSSRQKELQSLLSKNQLKALVLNPGPDLNYLTGLDFHLMERPVMGIFPSEGTPVLVLPELEAEKVNSLDFDISSIFYNEDQSTWSSAFRSGFETAGFLKGRVGVIPRRLRLLELDYIESAAPDLKIVSGQEILKAMRMIKSPEEVSFMAEAVRIAECALSSIISGIKPGISEKQLASKLVSRLFHEGSDPEMPFLPIVSFAENTANPHATPTERVLRNGELVLIDFGARHQGYVSDITRTFAFGDVNPEFEKIAQFVLDANRAGRAAVKPGIQTNEVDLATRKVIVDAGYGEFFIHRTGHGLGKEGHEDPYISQYDLTVLEPGMTFTIEPGIYLPGRGGVRIEDNVLVTENGCQSLSKFPRELGQLIFEI